MLFNIAHGARGPGYLGFPEGKNDWKPHPKSMPLGPLATIVATIPAWLEMVVNMDELDINPPGGSKFRPQEWKTRRDLLEQFDASLQKGREVLKKTTDDHLLNTKWRMLNAGKLMSEQAAAGGQSIQRLP